jgi:hypothetical protein
MKREDFRSGDRVEAVGPPIYPGAPEPGEQGTILFLHPMDDVISWDVTGSTTWDVEDGSIRLVPGAPRGLGTDRIGRDLIEFRVSGPLPERAGQSRCADRHAPNAAALFEKVDGFVEMSHTFPSVGTYPVDRPFGFVLTTPAHLDEDVANAAANAIIEVIVDANVLVDERQEAWERFEVDPELEDAYGVALMFDPEAG